MPRIGREDVERFAHLARLRLAPGEAESLARDLDAILGYVDQLASLATDSVEPTACVVPMATPLRGDEVVPSLDPEAALGGAPARKGTAFAVPRVLEGEEEP